MSTHTLSSSISNGIVLTTSGIYLSPFTVTSTGIIDPSSGNAVSTAITNASLLNFGSLNGNVYFAVGGSITNSGDHAFIGGNIEIEGLRGTIINDGYIGGFAGPLDGGLVKNANSSSTISGNVAFFYGLGTIVNAGEMLNEVQLDQGGDVTNTSLSSYITGNDGVFIREGEGKIVNYGTITDRSLCGIYFGVQYTTTTDIINNVGTSSLIEGSGSFYDSAAILSKGQGKLLISNEGTISSNNVAIRLSGDIVTVQNVAITSLISGIYEGVYQIHNSGNTNIQNQGTIIAYDGIGVFVGVGTIHNHTSALIYGFKDGISLIGTVINDGSISSAVGCGIYIGSGTVINSGTIAGGSSAINFFGSVGNSLIVDPGAVFIGGVIANGTTGNVLNFASGTIAGHLAGIGETVTGFGTIGFASGATWSVSGDVAGLAAGQTIAGFAAHDTMALDGFSTSGAGYLAGHGLVLNGATTLDLTGSLANNLVISNVTTQGTTGTVIKVSTGKAVVGQGAFEIVTSGGVARSSMVKSGGTEIVYAGGKAVKTTIAGGTLDVLSGGGTAGAIEFSGTGGELIVGSTTMPKTKISGFAAGDKIELAAVTYAAGASVTVGAAGTVTVTDAGEKYKLHIAGAKIGEVFTFGPGSLLTLGTAAAMAFLTPESAASEGAVVLPEMALQPAVKPTGGWVAAPRVEGGAIHQLRPVFDVEARVGITLHAG